MPYRAATPPLKDQRTAEQGTVTSINFYEYLYVIDNTLLRYPLLYHVCMYIHILHIAMRVIRLVVFINIYTYLINYPNHFMT